MERLPVSRQSEHSQESKSSENSDVIFLAVLNFVDLVFLEHEFNNGDNYDSGIKLVEAVHGISLYTQTKYLDGHLSNEDPGTVVVNSFQNRVFIRIDRISVQRERSSINEDGQEYHICKKVTCTDHFEELVEFGFKEHLGEEIVAFSHAIQERLKLTLGPAFLIFFKFCDYSLRFLLLFDKFIFSSLWGAWFTR